MKRFICVSLMLSVLFCLLVFSAAAVGEEKFTAVIETSSDSFGVGDEFYIKISLTNIDLAEGEGFIGYEFSLKYDPKVLEVIEKADGTFAEPTLPENWNDGTEKLEKLFKDDDGKQTGKIRLVYVAPIENDDLQPLLVKDESVYVNVKFRCIASSEKTSVEFDGESGVNCTVVSSEGAIGNVRGKNASLELSVKSESSGSGGTIICIAAAVVAAGAIIAIAVIIKKKKK